MRAVWLFGKRRRRKKKKSGRKKETAAAAATGSKEGRKGIKEDQKENPASLLGMKKRLL